MLLQIFIFGFFAFISSIWIAAVFFYANNFIGWQNIIIASPFETSSFVIAALLPLIILWLIVFIASQYIYLVKSQKDFKFLMFYLKSNIDLITPQIKPQNPFEPHKKEPLNNKYAADINDKKTKINTPYENDMQKIEEKISLFNDKFKAHSSSLKDMGLIEPDKIIDDTSLEFNKKPQTATPAQINDIESSPFKDNISDFDDVNDIENQSSFEINNQEDPLSDIFGYKANVEKKDLW